MARPTTTTEWLKHEFTQDERLQMGTELADAHNRLASIEEEESVVKAKFKERKASIEQKVGSLSREPGLGYTMQNVTCRMEYDKPNAYEVSIVREDTGETVRVRPMTADERQAEIEFDKPVAVNPSSQDLDAVAEEQSIKESTTAVKEFFGSQDATATDQPEPIDEGEDDPEIADAENNHGQDDSTENLAAQYDYDEPEPELATVAAEPVSKPRKSRARKPEGFTASTNSSAAEW